MFRLRKMIFGMIKCNVRPREVLQAIVKLLHPNVLQNSDPNSRTLYSKTANNSNDVICVLRIVDNVAECIIKSQDSTLAASIVREVEMKLRSLNSE